MVQAALSAAHGRSAIWSASLEGMLAFPARTLLRFFDNHGLSVHQRSAAMANGRGRLAKLCRAAGRTPSRADPAGDAGDCYPPHPGWRGSDRRAWRPDRVRSSCTCLPRRSGASHDRASNHHRGASVARRLPLPGQSRGAASRSIADAQAPGRVVELELPCRGRCRRRQHLGDLLDEQAARASTHRAWRWSRSIHCENLQRIV